VEQSRFWHSCVAKLHRAAGCSQAGHDRRRGPEDPRVLPARLESIEVALSEVGGTAPVLPVFSRRSGDDQVGGILSRLWVFVEIVRAGGTICSRGARLGLSAGLRKFGGAGARSRM
jgi:hypothetical protein